MKHMNSRRILAMLLALCMMACLLSMTAFAADPLPAEADPDEWDTIVLTKEDGTDLVAGTDYTVTRGKYSHYAYTEPFEYNIYNVTTTDAIVISGGASYSNSSLSNPLKSRISLGAAVTSVTLQNVTALGELSIADGSSVTFTLKNENNIDYIYGKGETTNMTFEGDGSLTGKHIGGVNKYGAAKGTNIGCNITINSGTFNITAGYEAAIGGGQYGDSGKIVINGGNITAKSNYGAAIGGGQNGDAAAIEVSDGEINATGSFGAAIGGGQSGDAKEIGIEGGVINARGSHVGAAIGGGQNGNVGKIEITDGDITVVARNMAIGGETANDISISGGNIKLGKLDSSSKEVTPDASQIGSKNSSETSTVTITGGTFKSTDDDVVNVSAYVPEDCTYNPETGEVTGAPSYVAYIGEQGYTTLEEAIEAVQNGETVEIAVSDTYSREALNKLSNQSKNVTIKAREGVVAVIDMSDAVTMSNSGTTTFENITFQYTTADYRGLQHAGNVVYNSCKINGTVFLYGTSEIFNKCVFTQTSTSDGSKYNVWVYGTPHAEFNNCTFNNAGKTIHVYNENNEASNPQLAETNVTLNSCTVKSTKESGNKSVVNIKTDKVPTELKLAGTNKVYYNETDITDATRLYVFSLYQGTEKPDSVKDSYVYEVTVNEQGEEVLTQLATTAKATGVAKITHSDGTEDGTSYATLAEAFEKAKDGDTITLLSNCSGDGIVVGNDENKNPRFGTAGLIVDFGTHTYTVGGVLVGSPSTGTNAFQLLKGNKVTFKNGSIVGVAENTKPAEGTLNWHGAPAIVIQNYCDLTLDGMTITGGDQTVYTMSNNCGNITINNTTINAGRAEGYTSPAFAFDVYGGWYKDDVTVTVTGKSVINGDIEIDRDTGDSKNTLKLEGCTVNGTLKIGDGAVNNDKAMVTKTNATILENEVAGHKWVDGKLTLDEKYVARIGTDKYFETLEAAVAGAANGDTILLLKDSSGNGIKVEANKFATGLTIDFNTHTYTFNGTPVGSTGSETQAAHFESGNKITLKNGKFNAAENSDVRILVQNYADLTLSKMELDGTNVAQNGTNLFTLSCNNGNVVIEDSTIKAPAETTGQYHFKYAIDICGFANYAGTSVTVKTTENGTSLIDGDIRFFTDAAKIEHQLSLDLKGGTVNGTLSLGGLSTKDKAKLSVTKDASVDVKAPSGYKWDETGTELVKDETADDYVASVDNKKYQSLEEAIDAVGKGGIVYLNKDIKTENGIFIHDKEHFLLNLGEHTITGTKAGTVAFKVQNADVKLKANSKGGIDGGSGGSNVAVCALDGANITIVSGNYTVGADANGEGNSTIYVNGNGNITIFGGTFSTAAAYNGKYYVLNVNNQTKGTITVRGNGAKFENFNPLNGDDNLGGNFCASSCGVEMTSSGSNGEKIYTSKLGLYQVLNKDGEPIKVYKTAEKDALLAAIDNGQTVMLLANATANITIPADKDFTLDLNGKTLNGGTGTAVATITNYGKVTITDSSADKTGKIMREDAGIVGEKSYYVIRNLGTMTIKNGTIYNNSGYEKANSSGSMEGSSLICNGDDDEHPATLNIEGGTLEQENFIAIKNGSSGTLVMTGGTVKSGHSAIQNWHDATITGGKVIGQLWTDSYIDKFSTGKTVFGGEAEFEGEIVVDAYYGDVRSAKPTMEITGGNLNVTKWTVGTKASAIGAKPEVSSGTFTSAVPANYCKDGFVPATLDGGKYGVERAKGDVKLIKTDGTTSYIYLADAGSAAVSGDKIELFDNVKTSMAHIKTGVTLDLNGYVLEADFIMAASGQVIDSTEGQGLLKVNESEILLNQMNSSLPLFDTADGGYRLFSYEIKPIVAAEVSNTCQFWFTIVFKNEKAYQLLQSAGHGLKITVQFGVGNDNMQYVFLPQTSITKWTSALLSNTNPNYTYGNFGYYLAVRGLDKLNGQTLTAATTAWAVGVIQTGKGTLSYSKTSAN